MPKETEDSCLNTSIGCTFVCLMVGIMLTFIFLMPKLSMWMFDLLET